MFLQEPSQIRILYAVSETQNLTFFGEACPRTTIDLHLTIYEIASPTKYILRAKLALRCQVSAATSLSFTNVTFQQKPFCL
jgi:hypothetical protein